MITRFKFLLTFLILCQSILASPSASYHKGGNGGDAIAAQFQRIMSNTLFLLKEVCIEDNIGPCLYIHDLEEALNPKSSLFVTVTSDEKVFADDGRERDAVNFNENGKNRIVVGRKRWSELKNFNNNYIYIKQSRLSLVIHEYLSLLGIESSDYFEETLKILSAVNRSNYDLAKIVHAHLSENSCSIFIQRNETLKRVAFKDLVDIMKQKKFFSSSNKDSVRYRMKTSLDCSGSGGFLSSVQCSVYTEIVDLYKKDNFILFTGHESYQKLASKNKVVRLALENVLSDLNKCSK